MEQAELQKTQEIAKMEAEQAELQKAQEIAKVEAEQAELQKAQEKAKMEAEQAAAMKLKEEENAKLEAEKERIAMEEKKAIEMKLAKEAELKEIEEANRAAEELAEKEMMKAAEVEKQKEEFRKSKTYDKDVKSIETKLEITEEEAAPQFGNVASQQNTYAKFKKANDPMFNYTGFKIVVKFSKDPISHDDDVYKRHDDLVEYGSKSGSILYMIGDFPTEEKADKFLVKTVSQIYPGAYIVGFKNGNRLN